MDSEHELKDCNVQAEILFVGSIAKDLDLIVNYSTFMRSKYDFSDPATKFFYDNLETYFLTFSQTLDETKMNVFMSQNEERLKLYKQYKGWKTLQRFMTLADENDVKNYFESILLIKQRQALYVRLSISTSYLFSIRFSFLLGIVTRMNHRL